MPRSTTKVVLFAKAKVAGKLQQHPIAIFPNANAARPHAVDIMHAHLEQDAAALKALGQDWLVAEDGTIATDLKFSRVELPYAPERLAVEADPFADESSVTS